jgi:hypothetical protein
MAFVLVALIFYAAFYQWLRHQRRVLIHRERLAAAEKGLPWPAAVEQEVRRRNWTMQRVLILAGLSWISISIGFFILLILVSGGPPVQVPWEATGVTMHVPPGAPWIALAPLGIGLAHLVVYAMGRDKDV